MIFLGKKLYISFYISEKLDHEAKRRFYTKARKRFRQRTGAGLHLSGQPKNQIRGHIYHRCSNFIDNCGIIHGIFLRLVLECQKKNG